MPQQQLDKLHPQGVVVKAQQDGEAEPSPTGTPDGRFNRLRDLVDSGVWANKKSSVLIAWDDVNMQWIRWDEE